MAGFAAYQTDEYNRIRLENPEMNRSAARGLSFAEAAGNVLLDRMQLKRLPVLAGLAREVRVTGWGRAARKAGLVWGEQTTQELAQNAIAPVFETIASAMRSDMTPRDAGQEFSRYVEDIPATLAATGWLALIGGGLASVRDIRNPQADVDVALRHWGFSAEQSRRIRATATPEAFDAAVREEMPRRTPENIAAGRREAETAWRQAEQQKADPAQPKLEAITRGERGTEWIVRNSQGRETLRTPNSETARLALAELQQSAARQRQASMLRFSKSGDQAENVGRMWVELAKDKRTMQHGETSDAKDLGTLLTEISPEAGQDVQINEQKALNGQNDGYVFTGSDGGEIKVGRYIQDEYFFDTQNAGEHSTPINQAAYAGALNNGNKMVEDPGGLLYLGVLRRTSQMLSAALRAGTTRHMEPGPASKITGWREEKSEADFFHNVGLLAMKEAELVHERLKGLDALRYDGESQAFYDGEHRIPAEKVNSYLGARIAGVDSGFSQRIGPATLRRALATRFAEEAGTLGGGRLGQHAEASPNFHRIRYVRKDRGEQEVPGSQETSAGGEPAEVSGGTRRPRDNGGVSPEQARQWVDEVLRKWGSQLDVTVHESAEAIPDAAMRDEVLREGNVEGFYFGADRRVHVLADQIRSRDRVEPLLKHEGLHWAVAGPLKAEFENLRQWVRENIPADELERLRRNYSEEVVVEEYLAHLAETNPKSTIWKRFVYEFRRLLRRVLGDHVEFTEEDLRAFLAKAQKRVERARSQKRGDVHTGEALREGGDDLKLSRSARALLDGEESIPPSLALQAMREAPDHPVTRALKSWFVGGFRDIQSGKAPETEAILRKFLLRLSPYESKTPLYRGVPFRNEPELRAFLKQFQGDEWVNAKPFMSATKDGRTGFDFVKNSGYPVFVEIRGAHSGRDLEPFKELAPEFGWQKEVLYSKEAKFRVVRKPQAVSLNGKTVYYIVLEEIR